MKLVSITSFAPRMARETKMSEVGDAYQDQCYQAARNCIGNHVSLNYAHEIDGLSERFPNVKFVSVGDPSTSLFARPLVDFGKVQRYIQECDADYCAIINSDVYPSFTPEVLWSCIDAMGDGVLYVPRVETRSLSVDTGIRYLHGLDFFVVPTSLFETVSLEGMALGVPWWDYALPTLAILAGVPLYSHRELKVLHLVHDVKWSHELWARGLQAYAAQILHADDSSAEFKSFGSLLSSLSDTELSKGQHHEQYLYQGGAFFARWNIEFLRQNTRFLL